MSSVVADTHAAIWFLLKSPRITIAAFSAMEKATQDGHALVLPSISLVEVTYLSEKGRISHDALNQLLQGIADQNSGWVLAPLDIGVVEAVRKLSRTDIPDMPDRIIAATAVHLQLPLVTCDAKLQASGIPTIW